MKMKSVIAYATFFIIGATYTQDRALNSFEAAKSEFSRLLKCRDWMKAGSSKEVGMALFNFGIGALQASDLTLTGQNLVRKVSLVADALPLVD